MRSLLTSTPHYPDVSLCHQWFTRSRLSPNTLLYVPLAPRDDVVNLPYSVFAQQYIVGTLKA